MKYLSIIEGKSYFREHWEPNLDIDDLELNMRFFSLDCVRLFRINSSGGRKVPQSDPERKINITEHI